MRPVLLETIRRSGGVIDRQTALTVVARHVLDDAVRSGAVVSAFRGVYVLGEDVRQPLVRWRAALVAVPASALSHTTALAAFGLLTTDPSADLHLTVRADSRRPGRQPGLTVHRRRFVPEGVLALTNGLTVTTPERATVDAWPLLSEEVRRRVVIDGVRSRRLRVDRLRAALDAGGRSGCVSDLTNLVQLLAAGCQSELEIWGLAHVFDHPSLPRSRAQVPVALRGRTIYLDRAYDALLVAVEMDGAAFHFAPSQREKDMRRDAELATLGWVVLRFSYRRLMTDPAGVRAEIRRVLEVRLGQLARH